MGILKQIFIIFILIFPFAEVARLQFSTGVAVSLNDLFLFVLITSWIALKYFKKEKPKKEFLKKPILLFSAVALISLLLNFQNLTPNTFLISFLYLLRYVFYAAIYFIVKDSGKEHRNKIANAFMVSGLVVLLLGYAQFFLYPNLRNLYYLGWDEHLYRMFSTFLDPNFAGTFFVIFFLFSLTFVQRFIKKKNNVKFLLSSLISFLSLGAVYLTYSRSALLMLLISTAVFLIIIKKTKFLFLFLIIFILLIFLSPKSFQTEGTNILRITSSEARGASMRDGTEIFLSNPVFGVGFNAYRYAQHARGLTNPIWQITHSGAGTDNSFIFVLATTGIVGFISYIYLFWKQIKLALLNIKKNRYAPIFLSVLIGLTINSLFINSLFYVLILECVWILAGLTENNSL